MTATSTIERPVSSVSPFAGAVGREIVGANFGLKSVLERAYKVAPTDAPVLLLGETGVGKDVIADAVHRVSRRREGPFVAVNCGAIPESLVESELFGHEKGAFTGALATKRGRFERANGGTIFLDEIGELPLQMQVRLLRVLQNREVERVGATEPIRLDIRIIAASNRNLPIMVQENRFREDLWFRLNVFPITVPPLRERTADLPELVEHFRHRKARELKLAVVPPLAVGSVEALLGYAWPGNVRELGNLVERAMILNPSGPIDLAAHLPVTRGARVSTPAGNRFFAEPGPVVDQSLDGVVRRHIERTLASTDGRIEGSGGAAEILRVNPSTLRNRIRRLGVTMPT